MNVKIESLPPYRIAYLRQTEPYGPANIQLMRKLKKWAKSRNLLNENSIILGIAHDDPKITPAENCRYDTCLVVSNDFHSDEHVNLTVTQGGQYAVYQVEHTSEAIAEAWNELFVHLHMNGYQIDGRPFFERYTGQKSDDQFEPALVELCIPIVDK